MLPSGLKNQWSMQSWVWEAWTWTISPKSPLRTMLSRARLSWRKLQFSSIMQGTPVASWVSTRSQHSSKVMAAGTSTAAYFPLRIAVTAMGVCQSHDEAMTTASMSSLQRSRWKSSGPWE